MLFLVFTQSKLILKEFAFILWPLTLFVCEDQLKSSLGALQTNQTSFILREAAERILLTDVFSDRQIFLAGFRNHYIFYYWPPLALIS